MAAIQNFNNLMTSSGRHIMPPMKDDVKDNYEIIEIKRNDNSAQRIPYGPNPNMRTMVILWDLIYQEDLVALLTFCRNHEASRPFLYTPNYLQDSSFTKTTTTNAIRWVCKQWPWATLVPRFDGDSGKYTFQMQCEEDFSYGTDV